MQSYWPMYLHKIQASVEPRGGLRERHSNRIEIYKLFSILPESRPHHDAGCCARFTTPWALSGHLNREDFHNGAGWRERAPARLSRGRPETVPSYRLWSSLDDYTGKGHPGQKGGERKGRPTGQELAQLSFNVLHNSQYLLAAEGGSLSSSSRNVFTYQETLQGFLLTDLPLRYRWRSRLFRFRNGD